MIVGAGGYPNSNLTNLIEIKKTYKKHKNELENIKRAQSQSVHSSSLYSPQNKFINLHDSMKDTFTYARQYNQLQKMQNILDDNKKIVTKIRDIQNGESDLIPRIITDIQPRKTKKRRRTKSRRLREEIENISSLLEQEDKLYENNINSFIGEVNIDNSGFNQSSQKNINNHINNYSFNNNSKILLLRKSLNMEFKNEIQRQIAQNNTQLINKIVNVQSCINHKELEKEFKQNQKYKKNVRKSSKSRQQFLNGFLESHFQRSNSRCHTQKQEKLIFQKPYQNIKSQHQQNSHLIINEKTNFPSSNIQLFSSYDENINDQSQNENLKYNINELEMNDTKNRNSHSQTMLKIKTQTEPDCIKEREKMTLAKESKTQSNSNLQLNRKHRSYSLKPDSQTVSFAPFQNLRIENEIQQNKRKFHINVPLNLPPQVPLKKIQEKFKQQTWKRNNNLFQIQPLRSASILSNYSHSRKTYTSNECTPSAQDFRVNRILSPIGNKFRSHNQYIQRPLSQIQNSSFQGKINYTDQSSLIQKSLSLIESDFDEKYESQNEFNYKNLKEMNKYLKKREFNQYQLYCNQIQQDNVYDSKKQLQNSKNYHQIQTDQNVEQEQMQFQSNLNFRKNEKENVNIIVKPSINQGKVVKQTNQYLNDRIASKDMTEKKNQMINKVKLTSNNVFVNSPDQFQSNDEIVTNEIQMKNSPGNIKDKEKYLLINSKQKLNKPTIANKQNQRENQQVITSQYSEPAQHIQSNSNQQFQDVSNQKQSRSRIQQSVSNECQLTGSRIEKGIQNKGKQLFSKKQNFSDNKLIQLSYADVS